MARKKTVKSHSARKTELITAIHQSGFSIQEVFQFMLEWYGYYSADVKFRDGTLIPVDGFKVYNSNYKIKSPEGSKAEETDSCGA